METPGDPDGAAPAAPAAPAGPATPAPATQRVWLWSVGPRRVRGPRKHPYADELSTPEELAHEPRRVAFLWLGLATALAVLGILLSSRFSPHVPGSAAVTWWEEAWEWPVGQFWGVTDLPLFAGLGLLGFGFVRAPWAKRLTLAGWLLFAFYWAMVAQDLFYVEVADYVNFTFSVAGVYFFTYLAYHQWLSGVRRVDSHTVHFLNVATFVAAGAYFVVDRLEPLRRWLILTVSDHTYWMLDLFGQGRAEGLTYLVNPTGSTNDLNADLALFWYPQHYNTIPSGDGFWGSIMHYDPTGASEPIGRVSIILACTALQTIMLFVGLFLATPASWKKRLWSSLVVAIVVYVLNLVRNTGIIWFYGQGEASFWVMHDAIGKGGSLIAMVAIAFAAFAWFPEFLKALIGVLDLPYRDGPLERALRLGKRRPEPPQVPPAAPVQG